MPADRREWADAFAEQSASDLEVYEMLAASAGTAPCHSLHYLQMACEKIAKAYSFRDRSTSEDSLTTSHVAFSKFIDGFVSSPAVSDQYHGRDAQLRRIKQRSRTLAREIEKLAPAVDRENSPSNAEYPWETDGRVTIPCRYTYPNLSSLREPTGVNFLKLVREAIISFDQHVIR